MGDLGGEEGKRGGDEDDSEMITANWHRCLRSRSWSLHDLHLGRRILLWRAMAIYNAIYTQSMTTCARFRSLINFRMSSDSTGCSLVVVVIVVSRNASGLTLFDIVCPVCNLLSHDIGWTPSGTFE